MRHFLIAIALLCAFACAKTPTPPADADGSIADLSADAIEVNDGNTSPDSGDSGDNGTDATNPLDVADTLTDLAGDADWDGDNAEPDGGDVDSGDASSCDPCTPNATRCKDGQLESCDTSGCAWSKQATCAAGCLTESSCKNCEFEAMRCGPGGDIERCDEPTNGWVFEKSCQQGCGAQHGIPLCKVCGAGESSCGSDGVISSCAANQLSWDEQVCTYGCRAENLTPICNTCTPLKKRCTGQNLDSCRADGSGWDSEPCTYACNQQGLYCMVCEPNSVICGDDGSVKSCSADGKAWTVTPCEWGCDTTQATPICNAPPPLEHRLDNYSTHTCALIAGKLSCWGFNRQHQISSADDPFYTAPQPNSVSGPWLQVSTANFSTCAIKWDRTLWCWGNNSRGELGTGNKVSLSSPTLVSNEKWLQVTGGYYTTCGIKYADRSLWCWGYNANGQAGQDDTGSDYPLPQSVGQPGMQWQMVALGANHVCAITAGDEPGKLYCWGRNLYGELGDGTKDPRKTPTPVSTGLSFVSVALGQTHTCGITTGNALHCWGLNSSGQLGINSNNPSTATTPQLVYTGGQSFSWRSVQGGERHTCAVQSDDSLWCWGGNSLRELADDLQTTLKVKPTLVSGQSWAALKGRSASICGFLADGTTLACWGHNAYGQLGLSPPGIALSPLLIDEQLSFETLTSGTNQVCGKTATGMIYCWGGGLGGQLGFPATIATTPLGPLLLPGGDELVAGTLVGGNNHGCAIEAANGILHCWGLNSFGQLGDQTSSSRFVPTAVVVTGTPVWSQISAGGWHTCGIQDDASLWCWGRGELYALGTGTIGNKNVPTKIEGFDWHRVGSGENHTCAIRRDDVTAANDRLLYCWGYNTSGQTGVGNTTSPVQTPQPVVSAAKWLDVVAGISHTCAIKDDLTLWCWGANGSGQVGDGTSSMRTTPVQVGDKTWKAVALGEAHTCGIQQDDTLWCWGSNGVGQLGNGSFQTMLSPVQVLIPGTWHLVTIRESATCAIEKSAGTRYCWGLNDYGAFGNGTRGTVPVPTIVDFGK